MPVTATPAARQLARRPHLALACLLLLLPLVYFLPAVVGRVLLAPGDGWSQILGLRMLIGQMLARGELPLWNPYLFGGMPLLASIQPGALYPPTWLFAVLSPGAAMNTMLITTYHLALIGTYLYARRIGCTRVGALVAGCCFTFGGYLIAHLGHTNRVAAAVWLPWILLALEHLYWRARWSWIALGALFIALQLFAGEPQMNCYTVWVAVAYALAALWLRAPQQSRARLFGAYAVMALCGLLFSAAQLLPERELLRTTARAAIDFEYFSDGSLPPQQWLGLIFPYFFGGGGSAPYRVAYWGASNPTEMAGYVGMLGLLLASVALCARRRMTWFWALVATLALVLAARAYLPFGAAHLLHHIPVYNLFRSAGRHLFECDFALAVLAGLGATALEQLAAARRRLVFRRAAIVFAALVAGTAVLYRFAGRWLQLGPARPLGAAALTNAEAFVPLLFAALSLLVAWRFARRPTALVGALVVAVLFVDLCSFGQFYEWPSVPYARTRALADPPAVAFLKAREPDLNAFRVLTDPARLDSPDYAASNAPNLSLARGLQSVNGYDPLRIVRATAIAGAMSIEGALTDPAALDAAHTGFDLLGVKYLLRPLESAPTTQAGPQLDGIQFAAPEMNMHLAPGAHHEVNTEPTPATELALVSALANAEALADDTLVAEIKLHTTEGQVIRLPLRAGRDTAEAAYERADVRRVIKHQRARISDSWRARDEYASYEGHHYFARLPFAASRITRIEFDYAATGGELNLLRAALYDATAQQSTPLAPAALSPERWRKLAQFDAIEVYENLRARPRAWFVQRLAAARDQQILDAIRTGRLPDGSAYDPAATALLNADDLAKRNFALPTVGRSQDARAEVTGYGAQRVELATHNRAPGFLVVSEIAYKGWEAYLDGARLPIERVNFILRGVQIPPGDHRLAFLYRPRSFRDGLWLALAGALLLVFGFVIAKRAPALPRLRLPQIRLPQMRWPRLREAHKRWARKVWWPLLGWAALVVYAAVLINHAAYGVGGADSSGYGRAAQSLLRGRVVEPVPELERLGLPESFTHLFVPIGSTFGPRPGSVVSFYPVGLPLHLALAALVGGWHRGPFWVCPLAAAFSLLLIYRLGRELGLSRGLAALAALLLGVTPIVLFSAQQPVSDVLAMCWALATVWAALRARRGDAGGGKWALLAGAAFGIGFLVRPLNLLVLLPAVFALPWRWRAWLRFGLGGVPLAILFCAYNYAAFGHPLQTGYGAIQLHSAIQTTGAWARGGHYLAWVALVLSPATLIAWLGLVLDRSVAWRTRALLLAWFGGFLFFYSCYAFESGWVDTRFLLPGLPALILGALVTARDAVDLLRRWLSARAVAVVRWALIAALVATALSYALQQNWRANILGVGAGEMVYVDTCRAADQTLPPEGMLIAGEMSGALKFYTQRSVVRWDAITPEQWPTLRARAEATGGRWYALLAAHELEQAQAKVPGARWRQLGELRGVSLWAITF